MTATPIHTTAPTSWRTAVPSAALGFLAGGFFANGVPHTVFGLLGQEHTSPFGTSAGVNLGWGLANLALGIAFGLPKPARRALIPFTAAVGVGALSTAISLLVLWR